MTDVPPGVREGTDPSSKTAPNWLLAWRSAIIARLLGKSGPQQAKATAGSRAATAAGLTVLVLATALILLLLGISFHHNRAVQSELLNSATLTKSLIQNAGIDLVEVRASDPGLEDSLLVLGALRDLPQGYRARKEGEPGLLHRFGLYQSSHSEAAVEAYREGLRRILLPRLLLRLKDFLAENSANAEEIYEPLKIYLMLGGQGPLDSSAARNWIVRDWQSRVLPGPDRAGVRKELERHLSTLLEDPDLSSSWRGRRAPLSGAVIESARAAVATLTLADRAYVIMREQAVGSGQHWQATDLLKSGDEEAFANGQAVRSLSVPYFYTRSGFNKVFQPGLAQIGNQAYKEAWVLGADAAQYSPPYTGLKEGLAARYAQDYIAAWTQVISKPQPASYLNDPDALGALTKAPSPLKVLLLSARMNTALVGGSTAGRLPDPETRMARLAARIDPRLQISAKFKPVHDYVGDGSGPAPIDDFLAALKSAGSATASARFARSGEAASLIRAQSSIAMSALDETAASAPPQLQGFVSGASRNGAK